MDVIMLMAALLTQYSPLDGEALNALIEEMLIILSL